MTSEPRKILFLSHSASRNGASILLLHTLKWLREHTDYQPHVLCAGGGPLLEDFAALAPTRLLRNTAAFLRFLPLRQAPSTRSAIQEQLVRWTLPRGQYDLVYANTVATWAQVAALARRQIPLIWHIHELPYAIDVIVESVTRARLFKAADRFVAVSQSVADSLTQQYAVPADRIDLVHGFVSAPMRTGDAIAETRKRILGSLGWPEDSFVVGGCGGLGWRKGTDLFLQVARRSQEGGTPMRFLWVGGRSTDLEALQFDYDVRRLGLSDVCRHVPSTLNVLEYYCAMDVFALTSREDPYPLVMLEAGLHSVPTVCFANSGGGAEFVGEDAGIVTPYLDIEAFASALQTLRDQPALRAHLGRGAQDKVRAHHHVDNQAPKLVAIIQRCLAAG